MTAPRLEVRLDRIGHNARTLVERLGARGIAVTGVAKATLGSPAIVQVLQASGVVAIGDSRIENIERLRGAGVVGRMTLIRSPMPSQTDRVVASADVSLNTEIDVLARLSEAAVAQGRVHEVVLMVELGDLREGIMPGDLDAVVADTLDRPGLRLLGIGTNLACQSGVAPDAANMAELSTLASRVEDRFGLVLDLVSGGNSANLDWVFGGGDIGRINELRLGESVLLGCEPLRRTPIEGLHTDAFTLVTEVIESKVKPTVAWGDINQSAFGEIGPVGPAPLPGSRPRVIVALGRQDADPDGLTPPPGMAILGASSDHLLLDPGSTRVAVGTEVAFQLDYSALLRAMTSPFVTKVESWS